MPRWRNLFCFQRAGWPPRAGWFGMAGATALLVLLSLPSPRAAQAAVGRMAVLAGQATVLRGDREIIVRHALLLEADDVVRTAPQSKVHVVFFPPLKGSDIVATQQTEFEVREWSAGRTISPLHLVWGAIRSRLLAFSRRETFMQTRTATIGVKGTDFIVYVKKENASEFIGVEGVMEATSRSRPEYALQIAHRQWGEIVEGQKPKPPVPVPDELWYPALREFSFPGETPPAPPGS